MAIFYMSNNVIHESDLDGFFDHKWGNPHSGAMRTVIVSFGGLYLIVEVVQMITLSIAYFDDFWNYFMLLSTISNLTIVF